MANTQAMTTSFKVDLFNAVHAFNSAGIPAHTATTADSFKAALYLTTATKNASTTAFTTSDATEVSGTGYTSGGVAVTFATAPNFSGTTSFLTPSASITYTTVTLATSFDAMLLYNTSQSNKSVAVYTFSPQTVAAGTFTLTMPTNDASTGLLRIA